MRRRNTTTYYTTNKKRRSAVEDPRVWLQRRNLLADPYLAMLGTLNPKLNKRNPWRANSALGRFLQSKTPETLRLINNAVKYLKTKTQRGKKATVNKVKNIARNVADTVGNAVDTGKDALVRVWDTGRNAASAAWDATANAASTALHLGEQTRNALVGAVGHAFQNAPLIQPDTTYSTTDEALAALAATDLSFLDEPPTSSHVTISETENNQQIQDQIQHKDQTEQEATIPKPSIVETIRVETIPEMHKVFSEVNDRYENRFKKLKEEEEKDFEKLLEDYSVPVTPKTKQAVKNFWKANRKYRYGQKNGEPVNTKGYHKYIRNIMDMTGTSHDELSSLMHAYTKHLNRYDIDILYPLLKQRQTSLQQLEQFFGIPQPNLESMYTYNIPSENPPPRQ